jgi:hypothetical protein
LAATAKKAVSNAAAYTVSMGFRTGQIPDKVNLQLFTHTLRPAAAVGAAPTPLSQGPFDAELDRSLFTNRWAHVAMTFDSSHLRLYVDGSEVAAHPLPTPGPAAEVGGLVIGGHREGAGRNYDGLIDEVALWQRVLETGEVTDLYNSGAPEALPTEVSAADTDGDTLEDWYEGLFGLDPEDSSDAMADTDNDGVPAWLERKAGTSPNSDNSEFFGHLRQAVCVEPAMAPMVFRHPSEGTVKLRIGVQQSATLSGWQLADAELEGEAIPEAGLNFQLTSPPPLRGFFRVSVDGP